jgi:hypothetical protein
MNQGDRSLKPRFAWKPVMLLLPALWGIGSCEPNPDKGWRTAWQKFHDDSNGTSAFMFGTDRHYRNGRPHRWEVLNKLYERRTRHLQDGLREFDETCWEKYGGRCTMERDQYARILDSQAKAMRPATTPAEMAEERLRHPLWIELIILFLLLLSGFVAAWLRWGELGLVAFMALGDKLARGLRTAFGWQRHLGRNPALQLTLVLGVFLVAGWGALVAQAGLWQVLAWMVGGTP